jgi:hypothetical protein
MARFACICLLVMSVVVGSPCIASDQGEGEPVTAPDTAVALAAAYTGLPDTGATSAVQRMVTDPSVPVFDVTDRSVWEVVFSDVTISVPGPDGAVEDNANIHEVHVWLDSQTGTLVKVSTPHPTEGGLTIKVGTRERQHLTGNRITVRPWAVIPAIPFLPALSLANAELVRSVPQAKEIVAYYGMMTDSMPACQLLDRPSWLVYVAGISVPVPYGPPQGPGTPPASEALVILDAETGAWHLTFLSGGPAEAIQAMSAAATGGE